MTGLFRKATPTLSLYRSLFRALAREKVNFMLVCVRLIGLSPPPFSGLHGIELSSNPWTCDCDLRPLKQLLDGGNVPYTEEPVCSEPRRISGRRFGDLLASEFACPPEIVSAPRVVDANAGEKRKRTLVHFS